MTEAGSRRRFTPSLGLAAMLVTLGIAAPTQAEYITVVSWGGSYARACQEAIIKPFMAETGIEVRLEDYNGGLAQIRAQVETGSVRWDVVDMEVADATRGCDEGLLEEVDTAILAPSADGTPVEDDYLPDTIGDCGASTIFYSTVYAYNADRMGENAPQTVADFFDLERFPGRRGMRRSPLVNMEFALMADGVPPDQVYAVMDTEEGIARAFRKLDTIKDQVVWWEAGAQPPQMLADGEVAMSTAYNGRIFNAQVLEGQPFVIVWDGQVLDHGPLGVVAGTPRLENALKYVSFASRPEVMAAVGKYIAYSPARRSALPFVSTHLATGVEMRPHMPTSPENAGNALRSDWQWWSDNGDEMNERFATWLAR